jgi:AcrR family transcriptional regulator
LTSFFSGYTIFKQRSVNEHHLKTMTDLTPRERRYQKTRQAILQAALDIIAEKGVEGLALREVAQRIDYSPAGLYEYFKSKDELITAVCLEGFERLADYLNQVPADLPPAERLTQLGLAYLNFARQNRAHFLFIFTTISPSQIAPDQLSAEAPFRNLWQTVQALIDTGQMDLPPGYGAHELAYVLWSLVHGMAMLELTPYRSANFDLAAVQSWVIEKFWRR